MNFIPGKKTYLVAAVAIGYAAGIRFGLWPHHADIDLLLAALAAAALRSALADLNSPPNSNPANQHISPAP